MSFKKTDVSIVTVVSIVTYLLSSGYFLESSKVIYFWQHCWAEGRTAADMGRTAGEAN